MLHRRCGIASGAIVSHLGWHLGRGRGSHGSSARGGVEHTWGLPRRAYRARIQARHRSLASTRLRSTIVVPLPTWLVEQRLNKVGTTCTLETLLYPCVPRDVLHCKALWR